MIKVDKPIPDQKQRGFPSAWKEQLQAMEVGDCLFYPFPDQNKIPSQPLAYPWRCRRTYVPKYSMKFETGEHEGSKGVFMWRTK